MVTTKGKLYRANHDTVIHTNYKDMWTEINAEKLEMQLHILESVAEKLINGCITSGNISHEGKVKGYTIQNVVNNIKKIIG